MRFSLRTLIVVTLLMGVTFFGCVMIFQTKLWQRLDIDDAWALNTISKAKDIQLLLAQYRNQNGAFPASLELLNNAYQKPVDFSDPAKSGEWHYQKLGESDYQLFAIAKSWVSTYDAIVYRHSGDYPEAWFDLFDAYHNKEFDGWQYITGFSELEQDPPLNNK